MARVGSVAPRGSETTMPEEELIADCKKAMLDSRFPSVFPTTITVLADNGFTVLHESVHGLVFKNYTLNEQEVHMYDEDIGTMKQMLTAINEMDTTVVLSSSGRSEDSPTQQRTYVTPSLIVNKSNNLHCLRGHVSNVHTVVDETGGD